MGATQTSFDAAVRILFVLHRGSDQHYTICGKPRDGGGASLAPLCLSPPLSPSFFTPQQPSFSTSCLNIVYNPTTCTYTVYTIIVYMYVRNMCSIKCHMRRNSQNEISEVLNKAHPCDFQLPAHSKSWWSCLTVLVGVTRATSATSFTSSPRATRITSVTRACNWTHTAVTSTADSTNCNLVSFLSRSHMRIICVVHHANLAWPTGI